MSGFALVVAITCGTLVLIKFGAIISSLPLLSMWSGTKEQVLTGKLSKRETRELDPLFIFLWHTFPMCQC